MKYNPENLNNAAIDSSAETREKVTTMVAIRSLCCVPPLSLDSEASGLLVPDPLKEKETSNRSGITRQRRSRTRWTFRALATAVATVTTGKPLRCESLPQFIVQSGRPKCMKVVVTPQTDLVVDYEAPGERTTLLAYVLTSPAKTLSS